MFTGKGYVTGGLIVLTAFSFLWGRPAYADEKNVFEGESYTLTIEKPLAENGLDVVYSEFDSEMDYDLSYQSAGQTTSYFAKGDAGYYLRLEDYVYFCSFETGQLVPLCSRPDCLHDKETDYERKQDCYAYVPGGIGCSTLQYYEGKLYANSWFSEAELSADGSQIVNSFWGDYLYELSVDGSSRNIIEIPLERPNFVILHRGYIYYTSQISDAETASEVYSLCRVPLSGGKEDTIAVLEAPTFNAGFCCYPYGDYLYIEMRFIEYTAVNEADTVEYRMIYDIKNDRIQVEEVPRGMTGFYYYQGDTILCMTESEVLYRMDLDGRNFEPYLTLSVSDPEKFGWEENPKGCLFISMDESYLYRMRWDEAYQPHLQIYNRESGELLQCIPAGEGQYGMLQRVGIEDNFVFFGGDVADRHTIYWIEKDEMLKEGAELHQIKP